MPSESASTVAVDPGSPEGAVLRDVGLALEAHEDRAIFNPEAIAAAALRADGTVVCATASFRTLGGEALIDLDLAARAARGLGPLTVAVDPPAASGQPQGALFAYAPATLAVRWRLPPVVAEAASRDPKLVVVLTTLASPAGAPLADACRAHGLSGLQTRVVVETIRAGSVRDAATRLGVSYHTAREALAEAMRRMKTPRMPALVLRLTSHAFGVLPHADPAETLGDLWALSPRQAAIAGLVADGLSRGEAARALGLSDAVVKKEIDRVYLVMQVGSAAQLARKLAEANALRWLTRATGDVGFADVGQEPLRFVPRPDGTRIALSDYGPASGKPVLMVHSSVTSRIVSRRLLRALQAQGYRPIAIDRPGFGLTDEVPGAVSGAHDPYVTAADDTLRVLDQLGVERADLIARGAAQFVLTLAARAPARLGRVVLVNPDPHSGADDRQLTAFEIFKQSFRRNPSMIRFFIPLITRQYTLDNYPRIQERLANGSPPDEAAVRDPDILWDYFRAQRPGSTGRFMGCVNEQIEFARGGKPAPIPGLTAWRVLVGGHDTLHDPDQVLAYWRDVLPDTPFRRVADAGRLLALSHPQYVVEALTGA